MLTIYREQPAFGAMKSAHEDIRDFRPFPNDFENKYLMTHREEKNACS
jgi:hypothetical protein